MAKFYLGTVSSPDIIKFFMMSRFKDIYFPHEESVVEDSFFDIYYCSKKRNLFIEAIFEAFSQGLERGYKLQLEDRKWM
jgi:hypothetical protein